MFLGSWTTLKLVQRLLPPKSKAVGMISCHCPAESLRHGTRREAPWSTSSFRIGHQHQFYVCSAWEATTGIFSYSYWSPKMGCDSWLNRLVVNELRKMLGALNIRLFLQIPYWKIPIIGRQGLASRACRIDLEIHSNLRYPTSSERKSTPFSGKASRNVRSVKQLCVLESQRVAPWNR